jgi:hypothetical protein
MATCDRVDAAVQAYSEWMPTRLGDGGRIYRALAYGDLVSFAMLDRPIGSYDPVSGAGSRGGELYCNSVSSPSSTDAFEDVAHFHWCEGNWRGYLIVDFTESRMQADFFGFFDLAKELESRPVESWISGFVTVAAANHLTTAAEPVETDASAPALAP